MKTITNDFKEALKNIKQIDVIVSYADKENTNFIVTQNSEFLLTEAQDYLVTESAEVVIDNGGIQNCAIYWNTDVFKSVCKMLDLETSNAIPKDTELNIKIGLLVDGEYEYVDYGKFYAIEEPKYNLDTNTYSTTAYDKMIKFNIKAIENPLTFEEGTTYTLKQYLEMICNKCGVLYNFDWTNIINDNKTVINGDPYATNKEVTYRDILDDIAECLGTNFIINADNRITNKELQLNSVFTIDSDILKDTNIYIGEKKQAIDGLQVYDGSTMINYYGDDTSVFKIKNNNIMSAYSDDLLAGVMPLIHDFEYYNYQLETFGILFLEPFDCFTVSYKNTNYLLCSMHNDIRVSSGLSEEISYEFKEVDGVNEYTTSSSEDKTRDASIEIDKAKGQVVLKANADGNIVQVELDADADDGSEFNVKADNINLEGYTTINGNFKIDTNGNMECNNGTFTGGSISLSGGTYQNPQFMISSGSISTGQKRALLLPNGLSLGYLYQSGEQYYDWVNLLETEVYTSGAVLTIYRTIAGGTSTTPVMILDGRAGNQEMTIYGDLTVTGTKNRFVNIGNNKGLLLNAYETATPYFGDIGSDKTNKEGYCKIMIDDVFAQTIENDDYKVFVQKCGDGDLYVEKHKNYFEVKGTPNLNFDWELKAIQKGFKNVRLQEKEMKSFKGDEIKWQIKK